MRYLLDTNVLIAWIVRGDRLIVRNIIEHVGEMAISAIAMHELYFGAFNGDRTRQNLIDIDRVNLPVLPFEEDDARAAGEIRASLRRSGKPIGPYDLLIAGQALARNLIVVTANVGEFGRVQGLTVEDWSKP